MNLESIYYIGQTVAVAAILASLFAIWFQMRQSQKMERAAAQRELLWRVSECSRQTNNVSETSDNFIRGLVEYEMGNAAVQTAINGNSKQRMGRGGPVCGSVGARCGGV